MRPTERPLVEEAQHKKGRYGGFSFGGRQPEGVVVHEPLPPGVVFPNGARAALLLTFDVEGTYGNGAGDVAREIDNYRRICDRLFENAIPATFNVVGRMAEDHGPDFVEWMWDAGCEVASHGYVHDMNQRYGGVDVYAGHYGAEANAQQVRDGVAVLDAVRPGRVRGIRLPYGHFNEFTYEAIEALGLQWTSNVGIEDFLVPGNGFGPSPFTFGLGDRRYRLVEIPLDSQTYDWSIWMADEGSNGAFVENVRRYCAMRDLTFERTPRGALQIWARRMADTIESQTVFTLLCHPINLAVADDRWDDPLEEFLLPAVDLLGKYHREGQAWVCTCGAMCDFYESRRVTP